jgi:Peptidase S24-like
MGHSSRLPLYQPYGQAYTDSHREEQTMQQNPTLTFLPPSFELKLTFPLASFPISAGFPLPADDYLDDSLDLNDYFVRHPAATFYVRVSGESRQGAGIFDGDVLIVDRAPQIPVLMIIHINTPFFIAFSVEVAEPKLQNHSGDWEKAP